MSRMRRVGAVVGAIGPTTVIWTIAVPGARCPVLGHRLIVTGGPAGRESLDTGLAPVVVIPLLMSLAGWAVLALLEGPPTRITRRIWPITALAVLLMSFAPLLAPGIDTATRLTPGARHVAVASFRSRP